MAETWHGVFRYFLFAIRRIFHSPSRSLTIFGDEGLGPLSVLFSYAVISLSSGRRRYIQGPFRYFVRLWAV